MIHTIGVSFTAEMLAKAAYEETMGRATAWLRGPRKTPQDAVIAGVAADYAAFLRQTPWYQYPFNRKAHELWAAPVEQFVRGWETASRHRPGVRSEGRLCEGHCGRGGRHGAGAAGHPQRRVRTRSRRPSARMPDVTVIGERGDGVEIETPRYDLFTRILADIARQGGTIREIAGNDEIMVSVTVRDGVAAAPSSMGPSSCA